MSESPMKKQALLIGINQYAILPELKYARQDAEAVEESLKQNYIFSDDEVMLLTDAKPGLFKPLNKRIIQTHLENLANQELDLFIFGFWGHGLFRNGERYLCPLDVMGDAVEEQGFSFKELQRLLANVRAKNTCIILDCCQTIHDRGEAETLTSADKAVMENVARDIVLKRKEQMPDFQSNVVILNSCKEGQSAYEWDKRQHGIFTAHLLDAFSRRYESVSQIVGYISKNVNKTALELGKIQTPYSKLEGDIILPVRTGSTPLVVGDVFISYRHSQANLIAPIEAELKRRGISCFTDRVGVNYGMEYAEAIARAIKACKVLLVVWTQDANDSADMVREVKMALDLKKKVIPYKVGTFNAVEHNALYYQLAPISRYETLAQTPQSVTEIVNRIEQTLTGQSPTPVTSKPVSSQQYTAVQSQTSIVIQTHPRKEKAKSSNEQINRYIMYITLLVLICICFVSSFFAILKDNENARKRKSEAVQTPVKEAKSVIEQPVADTEESQSAIEEIDPDLMDNIPATPLKQPIILPKAGKEAGERAVVTVNGVEFAFRWCPAGTFTMGSPESEEGRFFDEKQHEVTLTKGFWIMETEVTNKQWNLFMISNPSTLKQDDNPVQNVSWDLCQEFCSNCSKVGFPVQLPTEAQWEYACRAGTVDAYAVNQEDIPHNDANNDTIKPVGSLYQNSWGIYDMHGNMPEWCQDRYGEYPDERVTDPTGPSSGMTRVVRSGVGSNFDNYTRSASRHHDHHYRKSFIGFRCMLPVEDNDSSNKTVDAPDKSGENSQSNVKKALSSKSVLQTGSQAGERAVVTVNGVEFAFRWCPAGTFSMGNLNDEYINPHHEVTLTKGFWMMETEVTQKQWKAVMGANPGSFKSEDCPVNKVSWNDCQEFCKKCSELGLPVELPTEAQWEYACRAGTTGDFAGNVDEMAWYGRKLTDGACPVGTKKPNAWGLYDMHGNVMEWCQDWEAEYPKESATDPTGPSNGEDRVIRGGFFTLTADVCSSHYRLPPLKPDERFHGNGFRGVVNEQ